MQWPGTLRESRTDKDEETPDPNMWLTARLCRWTLCVAVVTESGRDVGYGDGYAVLKLSRNAAERRSESFLEAGAALRDF